MANLLLDNDGFTKHPLVDRDSDAGSKNLFNRPRLGFSGSRTGFLLLSLQLRYHFVAGPSNRNWLPKDGLSGFHGGRCSDMNSKYMRGRGVFSIKALHE